MSDLRNREIFAANLQRFMRRAGVDRNQLCSDLGFVYSTVSEWLSAKKYPRIDKIEKLANYFGVQKSDLIEMKETLPFPLTEHEEKVITAYRDKPPVQPKVDKLLDVQPEETSSITPLFDEPSNVRPLRKPMAYGRSIPVLGRIPAGTPVEAVTDAVDTVHLPIELSDDGHDYFGLLVTGHSMDPYYHDGDYVIVRVQPTADSGDDVVAYIGDDHDATLKRLHRDETGIELRPLNDKYKTFSFTNQEVAELPVVIAGIVVQFIRARGSAPRKNAGKGTSLSDLYGDLQDAFSVPLRLADGGPETDSFFNTSTDKDTPKK